MKKAILLLALVACSHGPAGAGLSPGQAGPVTIYDPSGAYQATVNDAGQLSTTATLTGTVTVGTVGQGAPNTSANAWPVTEPSCNPVQQFGTQAYVQYDAGSHYLCSAYCYNSGTTTQYFQVQGTSTGPLVDAGPPILEFAIPASGGAVFKDPGAPGCVNLAGASPAPLAPGALSWDVSGASEWFIMDGGNKVNCNVCGF
jgi:hypothetical protein